MASKFEGYEVRVTGHFKSQMVAKGFNPEDVIAVIRKPEREYPSGSRYPGQWRLCGRGVCIVTKPEGRTLTLITCYVDGTLTEVRPDQLNTPQGRPEDWAEADKPGGLHLKGSESSRFFLVWGRGRNNYSGFGSRRGWVGWFYFLYFFFVKGLHGAGGYDSLTLQGQRG